MTNRYGIVELDAFLHEIPVINEGSYKFVVRLRSSIPPKIGRDN